MRWLVKNWFSILIYAIFFGGLTSYVSGKMRYHDVVNWPSVSAEITDSGGRKFPSPLQGRYGNRPTIDTTYFEFRYQVMGDSYLGTKATLDGGDLPPRLASETWKAYYKPSSPNIAVLNPVPFEGTLSLVAAVFSGIFVVFHFWFSIKPAWLNSPNTGTGSR